MPAGALSFTFVDVEGNTLRFDGFRPEFANATDYWDVTWLHCAITMRARVTISVDAFLQREDLPLLAATIRGVLAGPPSPDAAEFEPLEPYINLAISRDDRHVRIFSRLDLCPAVGPVIEFSYCCRPAEIEITLSDIDRLARVFPICGTPPEDDI